VVRIADASPIGELIHADPNRLLCSATSMMARKFWSARLPPVPGLMRYFAGLGAGGVLGGNSGRCSENHNDGPRGRSIRPSTIRTPRRLVVVYGDAHQLASMAKPRPARSSSTSAVSVLVMD
jgi:hypothetical protein